MLEPLMIVVVGLLVMVILIAMYLPLFQLSTTVM
jgi:type II secretory pathway component PulF